ncbi:hypothetical protein BC826DRAFT_31101 [Russula brevipes]|nr:hypothetical protein BC826DRAFT_31101 [Russula brevipes]
MRAIQYHARRHSMPVTGRDAESSIKIKACPSCYEHIITSPTSNGGGDGEAAHSIKSSSLSSSPISIFGGGANIDPVTGIAGGYPFIIYEGTVISGDPSLFREMRQRGAPLLHSSKWVAFIFVHSVPSADIEALQRLHLAVPPSSLLPFWAVAV